MATTTFFRQLTLLSAGLLCLTTVAFAAQPTTTTSTATATVTASNAAANSTPTSIAGANPAALPPGQVNAASAAQLTPTPGAAPASPNSQLLIPAAPTINAAAYILIDANTGAVIASMNPDVHRAPASLTKLMTMYVISQALASGQIHLTDPVRISKKAWQTGGSKMFVKVGDEVPVDALVHGIIIDSGNDACVAMSEYVAGSEDSFVDIMNQQAARLGMTNTHFQDVNGLPSPNHYTTARDLSTLARSIIDDFPQDYKWYSEKWFTYNKIKQPNRNQLLWRDPDVDGMKTGFTDDAGYCLVASAKKNNMRLIAVVLGAPSVGARFDDAQSLLTYGFRFYGSHKLYSANQSLTSTRVWKGQAKQVQIGVPNSVFVTIPRGAYKNLKAEITLNEPIVAPVKKGQQLGTLQVQLNGKVISNQPLLALQAVPKAGFWGSLGDSMSMSMHHMFSKDGSPKATS